MSNIVVEVHGNFGRKPYRSRLPIQGKLGRLPTSQIALMRKLQSAVSSTPFFGDFRNKVIVVSKDNNVEDCSGKFIRLLADGLSESDENNYNLLYKVIGRIANDRKIKFQP